MDNPCGQMLNRSTASLMRPPQSKAACLERPPNTNAGCDFDTTEANCYPFSNNHHDIQDVLHVPRHGSGQRGSPKRKKHVFRNPPVCHDCWREGAMSGPLRFFCLGLRLARIRRVQSKEPLVPPHLAQFKTQCTTKAFAFTPRKRHLTRKPGYLAEQMRWR